jgi:hypothetical protein
MKYMFSLVFLVVLFASCDNPTSSNDAEEVEELDVVQALLVNVWKESSNGRSGFFFNTKEKIVFYTCNGDKPDGEMYRISSLTDSSFAMSRSKDTTNMSFTFKDKNTVIFDFCVNNSCYSTTYIRTDSACVN